MTRVLPNGCTFAASRYETEPLSEPKSRSARSPPGFMNEICASCPLNEGFSLVAHRYTSATVLPSAE
ncbi:hypothetical protein SRABI128_02646 [Microbacterium sp. Bi128]|nr:hypothetical protein SRABI128_02646 [Microbacterium sp. Bi128]